MVHIPLHLYTYFIQPILQLVLPAESSEADCDDSSAAADVTRPKRPWAYEHPFVNVSVTPIECSVVCSVALAKKLFRPIRDNLEHSTRDQISISDEQYVVIQVDGEGLDAGQRVLELSSPLAMNGMWVQRHSTHKTADSDSYHRSIFFYSTYFSDYILVPLRSRSAVITALESRGFAFSKESEGFVNISSPLMRPLSHRKDSGSVTSLSDAHDSYTEAAPSPLETRPPSTPPPSSVSDLEARTFNTLKRRQVVPTVDPTLRLVQCAGRKDTLRGETGTHSSSKAVMHRLQLGLVKCLTSYPRPRFFSLTLTDTEPASLLLEKHLVINFEPPIDCSNSADQVLLGSRGDVLIPITFDLRKLPMESTGIVCGIAGRIVGSASSRLNSKASAGFSFEVPGEGDTIEMSYLSTARAGTVIIAEDELQMVLDALKGDEVNGVNGLPVDWLEMKTKP